MALRAPFRAVAALIHDALPYCFVSGRHASTAASADVQQQHQQASPAAAVEAATAPHDREGEPQQQQQQHASNSNLTEEQLAELFDEELQQRLAAATARRAAAADVPPAAPAAQPMVPAGVAATQSSTTLQPQRPWLPGGSVGSNWNPLLSSDPWAPLPSAAAIRQQLPQQVLRLLQQAGVSQEAAAEALRQASSSGSSSSSGESSGQAIEQHWQDQHTSPSSTNTTNSSGSDGGASKRKLFGAGSGQQQRSQAHASQKQPQHHQHGLMSVLSRLRTQQLEQLLHDCQEPVFGSKQVLLERLMQLLLHQQHALQDPQQQPQQGGHVPQQPQLPQQQESAAQDGHAVLQQGSRQAGKHKLKQQQQQQLSKQLPDLAKKQALLHAVLDVRQIGKWLLSARAQDVCVIDVRGRCGLQSHVIVATGLNQRHTRALAEAVGWQLQQAAKEHLQQQQQQQLSSVAELEHPGAGQREVQQQQQQQQSEGDVGESVQQAQFRALLAAAQLWQPRQEHVHSHLQVDGPSSSSSRGQQDVQDLLPPLNVVGDAASEWCLLDAGSVVVHVLTERARRFYALEALWGGPQGRDIQWLRPQQPRLETKDTIGRPPAAAVEL